MIKLSEPSYNDESIELVKQVLDSGQLVNGKFTLKFERQFAKYCNRKYCITTSNGTDAILIALKVAKIKEGDQVFVPALSFFATIEPILELKAEPVFVDVNPLTWCMDYRDMTKKLTDNVKACIPVHLFGQPCQEIIEIAAYCKSLGIITIEDCAQAHGATIEGRVHEKVGSFGRMGIFSFMATKNLPCGGEGGAIVTSSPHFDRKIRLLKQHGMTDRHTHKVLGFNSKMSEIECALASQQLENLDHTNEIRRKNSLYLRDMLNTIEWLQPQYEYKGTKSVFFWCGFHVDEELLGHSTDWLIQRLFKKGIEVRNRYKKPLYDQPAYKDAYPTIENNCKNAERLAGCLIGLPNGPHLTKSDLKRIIKVIKTIDTKVI